MEKSILFGLTLLLTACAPFRMDPKTAPTPATGICAQAGVPGGDERILDGVKHTNVCVQLQLLDTSGEAQAGLKPSVRVNVFNKTDYLLGVTDFKAVPNRDGFYAGRVPVNTDDEKLGYSILVQAAAYLDSRSGFTRFSTLDVHPEPIAITLVRDLQSKPAAWYPSFDNSKLDPKLMDWLRAATSSLQFLRLKGDPKPVNSLAANFASNPLDDDAEFLLAKAALLNIYSELNRENNLADGSSRHWLNYITGIRAIGQERIIVSVSPGMLQTLKNNLNPANDPFGCSGFRPAGSELHGRNFGAILKPKSVISVLSGKTPQCRGNLQITVGEFNLGNSDHSETFADIDFDDNYSFAGHAADVIDHWVTGSGTNPILIYEYLRARYQGADLGYTVVRKGSLQPKLVPRS